MLTVYIPTRNRPEFCNRLLGSLAPQMSGIEVILSSNGSLDGYEIPDGVRVIQQRTNTGGRVQWMLGPLVASREYCWMIGDDDVVLPGAVATILADLSDKPALLVNHDGQYDLGVGMGDAFDTYRDMVIAQVEAGRSAAVTSLTLASSLVFRRDAFDLSLAVRKCDTMYGQHYAILSNALRGRVKVVSAPTFSAGSSDHASIYREPVDVQAEHMAAYPDVIHEFVRELGRQIGYDLDPHACWVPGDGFDSPWRA